MLAKTEWVRGHVFATRAEANLALSEYIDQATANQANPKPRQPTLTS
jgi:uncharacterized protein YfcZ (UPF0381/DUF406 family)